MNNLSNFEEYNEGFKKNLAMTALGASLALGTPSCSPEQIKKSYQIEMTDENIEDGYKLYEVSNQHQNYHCVINSNNSIIATKYLDGRIGYYTCYVENGVESVYYRKDWKGVFFVTDDIKYDNNKYKKILLSECDVLIDYYTYKILHGDGMYFYVNKRTDTYDNTVQLGDIKCALTSVKAPYCSPIKFIVKTK